VDHIIVFRLKLRAAVCEQQLDERIQEIDIAFGRLQGRIDSWAVFPYMVNTPAIQLHDAFIARADIKM
jgi:hypothetical protein